MKKEISLEEVLNKYSIYLSPYVKEHLQLKAAIKELIYKALDLAAENAELESRIYTDYTIKRENYGQEVSIEGVSNGYWGVDIDSILQIKDWIK